MATGTITYFAGIAVVDGQVGAVGQVPVTRLGGEAFNTGSATESGGVPAGCAMIEIVTDTNTNVSYDGTNEPPAATTAHTPVIAGLPRYLYREGGYWPSGMTLKLRNT
ncbi:MAG: hypothetical protein AAF416_14415 [Pseudomonadota bacterium]